MMELTPWQKDRVIKQVKEHLSLHSVNVHEMEVTSFEVDLDDYMFYNVSVQLRNKNNCGFELSMLCKKNGMAIEWITTTFLLS